MVVKEKRGRRRYIAFRSSATLTDDALLAYLTSTFTSRGIKTPKVMQFDGRMGIIRCPPSDKDKVIDALSSRATADFSLETLSTSGTLRTLREKYFPTEERR